MCVDVDWYKFFSVKVSWDSGQLLQGVARCGLVWQDVARCCQVWPGVARSGIAWSGVARCCHELPSVARCGKKWPAVARCVAPGKNKQAMLCALRTNCCVSL